MSQQDRGAIGVLVLTLLIFTLLVFPLLFAPAAEALIVEICLPSCGAGTRLTTTSRATVSGVVTTTTNIATSAAPRVIQNLRITPTSATGGAARAVAQQSATLQRITFVNTTITCTAAPCTFEMRATSESADFPTPKPTGGYPATAFMSGFFTGTQVGTNGDTIAMTGRSSGISGTSVLNTDIINATPGGNLSTDRPTSLPSACTGNPGCLFRATTALRSFNTQISETVQQKCPSGTTSCQTRLITSVNISIKTTNNRVSLPAGFLTVDPFHPDVPTHNTPRDQIGPLISESLPPFDTFDVRHLLVHDSKFALDLTFTLDPDVRGGSVAFTPVDKEVFLQVGGFSMTIPPRAFRSSLRGKLFTFLGKVDGREVAASFVRHSNPATWTFAAAVARADLTDVPIAPEQTLVELAVGSDTGSGLVTAARF
jgi:hypothetical protein